MASKSKPKVSFAAEARRILSVAVAHRVNALGGYGPGGEVIYEAHPPNCPSVLVDSRRDATATFTSNGSVDFLVKLPDGFEVHVLDGSFDAVEKRETGVPSSNVWLELGSGRQRRAASIINPRANMNLPAKSVRVVKLGDPDRAMWYCATFEPAAGVRVATAARYAMVYTAAGPALVREILVSNRGRRKLTGSLWTYFNLHGTQKFVYNKQLWYDVGLPLSGVETVVAATVPYSDIMQIKRVSSAATGARPAEATCDYASFVGDTAASAIIPEAVRQGRLLATGAGARLNRFTTAAVAANRFALALAPGRSATVRQVLLYVTDAKLAERFRKAAACDSPAYEAMSRSFQAAAKALIARTPDARQVAALAAPSPTARAAPSFQLELPAEPAAAQYANTVWTGVEELYEMCRAHGAKLAQGIELGTRDRAQDMWPKMKEDPERVREDLVHVLGFMYVTCESPPAGRRRLSLREKLHGMFPRQYPSRWLDRSQEVFNDNRPYSDSPLWLIDALNMYIRETGDVGILRERVGTVRLTDPDNPIESGIVGCEVTQTVLEAVFEVFACFARHVADSPYGLAQILYGDWCDPVDMFGTSVVGDPATRGRGRGAQVRLTAHLFGCLVETIDLCEVPAAGRLLAASKLAARVANLKKLADSIRRSVVAFAWEDGAPGAPGGFLSCIHELKADGARPDYRAGEIGYTLGSMRGTDFDGIKRRELAAQAYCLQMLNTRRDYLSAVDGGRQIIDEVLRTTDSLFFDAKLGLVMFTSPIANNAAARAMVGRMGVVPSGCAENGEYHHCQAFMHRFRLSLGGQADAVWRQFKPIMSAMRDPAPGGPFEMPCTSYASDKADPHFGEGMYFGLSGSTDWIVEVFQRIAGLELALHDPAAASVRVEPNLPAAAGGALTLRRVIHYALPGGGYRRIPLEIDIRPQVGRRAGEAAVVKINGRRAAKAEVADLKDIRRLRIEISMPRV